MAIAHRITHELMPRSPGVFFNKLKSAVPIMISEAFDFLMLLLEPPPPLHNSYSLNSKSKAYALSAEDCAI